MLLTTSLYYPDHPLWQIDSRYSFAAARGLKAAYHWLTHQSGDEDRFLQAYAAVAKFRHQRVAPRQLMHIQYVLSMAYLDDGSYVEATESLTTALELAGSLKDEGASAALLHLRGALHRQTGALSEALGDYSVALMLTQELGEESGTRDLDLELHLLANMAGFAYYLADTETATDLLHEATTLGQWLPDARTEWAIIDWVRALLLHTQGELTPALLPAMRAAERFLVAGSEQSAARGQKVVAAIALDLAESLPAGTARNTFIELAEPYVRRCLRLARSAGDEIGEGLGLIERIRLDRLRGRDPKLDARLKKVYSIADRFSDVALRIQAQTAEARELGALGRAEAAQNRFREALRAARQSSMPVLGHPALRALVGASLEQGQPSA